MNSVIFPDYVESFIDHLKHFLGFEKVELTLITQSAPASRRDYQVTVDSRVVNIVVHRTIDSIALPIGKYRARVSTNLPDELGEWFIGKEGTANRFASLGAIVTGDGTAAVRSQCIIQEDCIVILAAMCATAIIHAAPSITRSLQKIISGEVAQDVATLSSWSDLDFEQLHYDYAHLGTSSLTNREVKIQLFFGAVLTVTATHKNPYWGGGLLSLLRAPRESIVTTEYVPSTNELNFEEFLVGGVPMFGAWCEDKDDYVFVSFAPNHLKSIPRFTDHFVRWACSRFYHLKTATAPAVISRAAQEAAVIAPIRNTSPDPSDDGSLKIALNEIGQLVFESKLPSQERFNKIKSVVGRLAESEHYQSMDLLLQPAFRVSNALYELIADCIEDEITFDPIGSRNTSSANGELNAMPVLIPHRFRIAERADWMHLIPRLPSGEKIPNLSDILFTWNDLNYSIPKTKDLHKLLREYDGRLADSAFAEKISEWRSQESFASPYDNVFSSDGFSWSLRFLVTYRQSDQNNWFGSEEEAQDWLRESSEALLRPFGIDLKPPRVLSCALYVGQSMVHQFLIRSLTRSAETNSGERHLEVFFEEFGSQSSSVSLFQRITVRDTSNNIDISQGIFHRLLRSDQARWRHDFHQIQEAFRREISCKMTLVPLVQPGELLSFSTSSRRLKFTLGATVAFSKPAPDGLPLNSLEGDEEFAQWWEYERAVAESEKGLCLSTICPALNINSEHVFCISAFTVEDRKWRPSIILVFDGVNRLDGIPLEWPPQRELLDTIAQTFCLIGGRKAIWWSLISSSNGVVGTLH